MHALLRALLCLLCLLCTCLHHSLQGGWMAHFRSGMSWCVAPGAAPHGEIAGTISRVVLGHNSAPGPRRL